MIVSNATLFTIVYSVYVRTATELTMCVVWASAGKFGCRFCKWKWKMLGSFVVLSQQFSTALYVGSVGNFNYASTYICIYTYVIRMHVRQTRYRTAATTNLATSTAICPGASTLFGIAVRKYRCSKAFWTWLRPLGSRAKGVRYVTWA